MEEPAPIKRVRGRPRKILEGKCRDCQKLFSEECRKEFYNSTWCKECRNEYLRTIINSEHYREKARVNMINARHRKIYGENDPFFDLAKINLD